MNISDRYQFDEAEHLHTLDGKPLTGTSSVMSIVGKPGLVYWSAGLAVGKLGWTNPKFTPLYKRQEVAKQAQEVIKGIGVDDYLVLLDSSYSAHTKTLRSSAAKGKDMHAELEAYVKSCIKDYDGVPFVVGGTDVPVAVTQFGKWACDNVEKFLWSELHTFSEEYWLGGITDCGAKMMDGTTAIIDFKSSKESYSSQFMQIGGYSLQLHENGAFTKEGEQVIKPIQVDKFIVIPFGAPEFRADIKIDTLSFENGFQAALTLYRLEKENE